MFTFIICVRLFSGKKRLIKNISLIIVIFLDIKYIKTRLYSYSNKILSQNFKPIKRKKSDESRKNSRVKFLENGLRKKTF